MTPARRELGPRRGTAPAPWESASPSEGHSAPGDAACRGQGPEGPERHSKEQFHWARECSGRALLGTGPRRQVLLRRDLRGLAPRALDQRARGRWVRGPPARDPPGPGRWARDRRAPGPPDPDHPGRDPLGRARSDPARRARGGQGPPARPARGYRTEQAPPATDPAGPRRAPRSTRPRGPPGTRRPPAGCWDPTTPCPCPRGAPCRAAAAPVRLHGHRSRERVRGSRSDRGSRQCPPPARCVPSARRGRGPWRRPPRRRSGASPCTPSPGRGLNRPAPGRRPRRTGAATSRPPVTRARAGRWRRRAP